MKILHKITCAIVLVILFASCQSHKKDIKQILSKSDTRNEIMATIANSSNMSNEMMETMINGRNGNMMMENNDLLLKIMNDNPAMMQMIRSNKVESFKCDAGMSGIIHNTLMVN